MKIGLFTDGYLPQVNGVSTTIEELKESLEKRKNSVYIIAPKYPNYIDEEKNILRLKSFKIFRNPEIRLSYLFPEKSLQKVLRTNFDIIHGFSGGSVTSLGLTLARIKRKPYVFTYNTRWNKYTHYILEGKVVKPKVFEKVAQIYCNACDHIIAPSVSVKKELLSFGVKKPITVIPNGVDTNKFKPSKDNFLRKKLHLKANDKIVLYVGRLAKEKSVDFLIKSFSKLANPNYFLVIVGGGSEKDNLQKLAKKLNIENRVYFLGHVNYDDIPKIYRGAEVFTFFSQSETQGMVILEAMSSGLPVLALNDKVFSEFIENGKDAILIGKNEKLFIENLKNLLENPNLRKKLALNARKKAQKFSIDEMTKKFENLYKELI